MLDFFRTPCRASPAAKQAILTFVERTTCGGSPDFVAPAERIAVLDNDGTLWAEQPAYFQLLFAIDRVGATAPRSSASWWLSGRRRRSSAALRSSTG